MMKYPGGVSKSELEVRLKALEANIKRVQAEASGKIQSLEARIRALENAGS